MKHYLVFMVTLAKRIGCISLCLCVIACTNNKTAKLPDWVPGADTALATTSMPQDFSGRWSLNETMSDDLYRVLQRLEHKSTRRAANRNTVDPLGITNGRSRDTLSVQALLADKRLAVLNAATLDIRQQQHRVRFVYGSAEPIIYLTDGQASSKDNNLNITLAGWEGAQLVIEKNGPGGSILERWTRSPDRRQLHVQLEFTMPLAGTMVVIHQFFDRIAASPEI